MSYDVEKREWLNKLFISKDNTIQITHVLYFSSKMYYIGIKNNKYFMCYFGHFQPCINNIQNAIEYIDNIEDIKDFPSTIVPIEDVVEIIDQSVINDLASNLYNDEVNKDISSERISTIILKESHKAFNSNKITDYNSDIKSHMIRNKLININENLGLLSSIYLYNDIKSYNDSNYFYKSPNINILKLFKETKSYKKRIDFISNNRKSNFINNLITSEDDTREYDSYKTFIIGHAIRIGTVNNKLFTSRYSSVSNSNFTSIRHSSIEQDNKWKYHNYMTLEEDKKSIDYLFRDSLEYEDVNLQPLLKDNNFIKTKIDTTFDDNIITYINENKFSKYKTDESETIRYDPYDILEYIDEELKDDEYNNWIKDGIKNLERE